MLFIFIIHDGLRRYLFLSLINKALQEKIDFKVLCFSVREYIWFRKNGVSGCKIKVIKKSKNNQKYNCEKTIDVAANFITSKHAQNIYNCTIEALSEIKVVDKELIIFGGNGLHAFDKAIHQYKNNHKNTFSIFTELSNIDGKVFFDNTGSNASSLFNKKLNDNDFEIPECNQKQLEEWKKVYCCKKINHHSVKQAPKKNYKEAILYRMIGVFEFIFRIPSYQRFKIDELFSNRKKVSKKLYAVNWEEYVDDISHINSFMLYPLQVFGDSQIKLHSKIDNLDALNIAIQKAKEKNIPLVVKPHPAEPEYDTLNKIIDIRKKNEFYISTNNTFELINKAEEVIVINSTVGLEAIISGKKVTFLGESFYRYFNDDRVLNFYLNHWLVNVNMFSMSDINDVEFAKIIKIAKLI